MGYYSEVAITLYEQDFETLVRRAAEEATGALDLIKYASLYKNNTNGIITMNWSSVKWYEGYGDVDFIMSFIRSGDTQYHFLRVGEEAGDVEEENNDEDWILCDSTYVERYINVESSGEEINTDSSVDAILQKKEIAEDDDDDSIEEVSEAELLNVISA